MLIPTIIATGGWLYYAQAQHLKDLQQAEAEIALREAGEKQYPCATNGRWTPAGDVAMSAGYLQGQFKSVIEDVDVRGAKIFLVDYGNNSRTVLYRDPRLII